ncbi:MAG: 16S rRNA (cytidine(1402)-2'-O)-methyltransferase [Actinomycetota bacterium]
MTTTGGALVVVGTPIGNLGDLSPRAAEALASADAIACEDTRRTGRLLDLSGIAAPKLLVANEHTETARAGDVIERIERGERVAVVSDAGMPTVSDPGRRLVAAVAEAGLPVEVVPGPTAAVTALAGSGLGAERFVFEGFLPRKGRARRERLAELATERRTVVLYEAPPRLAATLSDLAEVCGPDRPAVVARELTKLHEEFVRGPLERLARSFARSTAKGELVVVVEGAPADDAPPDDEALLDALRSAVADGHSTRDAVARVVAETGAPKRRVYDLALRLADGADGAGGADDEAVDDGGQPAIAIDDGGPA